MARNPFSQYLLGSCSLEKAAFCWAWPIRGPTRQLLRTPNGPVDSPDQRSSFFPPESNRQSSEIQRAIDNTTTLKEISSRILGLTERKRNREGERLTDMAKAANTVVGAVNFLTFVIAIVILGGGIWLTTRASTDCVKFLQWPIIIIGVALLVISLAGFAGSCCHIPWLLNLYLFLTFLVIIALTGFTIFAFAVTDKGEGREVPGRAFLEYDLSDYSGWLRDRVTNSRYWETIRSCLEDTKTCSKIRRLYAFGSSPTTISPEPAEMFYRRKLSPVEVN